MAMDSIDYRFRWEPKALWWLLGINTAVWLLIALGSLAGVISGGADGDPLWTSRLLLPQTWSQLLTCPWSIGTYMFTHLRFMHMLFNLIWLWWFGMELAGRGQRLLLLLYLGGGVSGAALFLTYNSLANLPSGPGLCGASASVMAVMTACAILEGHRKVRFLFGWTRLLWICIGAILLTMISSGTPDTGSALAHLGGGLFGAAAAIAVRKLRKSPASTPSRPQSSSARPSARHAAPAPVRLPSSASPERLRRVMAGIDSREVRKKVAEATDPEERLDALLDKIRLSGFDSLSQSEKTELNELSAKIGD